MKDEMEKQRQHEIQIFSMTQSATMFNPGVYLQQQPGQFFMQDLQGYPSVPFPSLSPNPQQATMYHDSFQGPSTSGV